MTERPLEIAPVVFAGGECVLTQAEHAKNFQRRHPQSPPTSPPNGAVGAVTHSSLSTDLESGSSSPGLEKLWEGDTGSLEGPVGTSSSLRPM